jgi:hypothetical protein
VDIAWDYLSHKFKCVPIPAPKTKDEVVAAVCSILMKAGWETTRATAAADLVWQYGIETGRRMSETKN